MKVKLGDVCDKVSSNIRQKDIIDGSGNYPIYGAAGKLGLVDFYQQDNSYIGVVKDGAGIGRTVLLPPKSSVIGTMQYLIPKENVLLEYLYYVVKHMHLEKFQTGATIPHIYFKDYKNVTFDLVPIERQKQIVEQFSKIERILQVREQQLSNLDTLVKARFVEMFGDPCCNQLNWKCKKLNEITSKIGSGATPKGGKESYVVNGVSFVRSLNVYDGNFVYKNLAHLTQEQASQLQNVTLEKDDVLINITGASVARSCIVPNDILPARVNQHVSILRPNLENVNPVFLNQLLISYNFKNKLLNLGSAGGATRQAITKQQLEDLEIILPPIELQNQFASFVQQVDKSKVAIQKSLDETQLLFDSLMQEYFS